ncbi:MAG: hypothetical protein ABIJ56_24510 [Pseudomonadota bacterium]
MMKPWINTYFPVFLLLLPLAAGCDEGRDSIFERHPTFMSPIALESSLAFVSATFEKTYFLSFDNDENEPVVETFRVGRSPYAAFGSADNEKLFVICHGAVEGEVNEEDAEEESLHVMDPSEGGTTVFSLGSPFTGISESDSGKWAVAYFSRPMPGTNPNLMAILDLDKEPSGDNPVIRDIRTLGASVLSVLFLENIDVAVREGGEDTLLRKNLALVLHDSYVTLMDLDHPGRSEISVRLTVPGLGGSVIPTQDDVIIANDPNGISSRVLLRSDNASDIFAITFVGLARDGADENDYRVSLNQLSVDVEPDAAPSDMEMFEDGGRKLVIAANRTTGNIAIVDPESTMVTPVTTDFPVKNILLFDEGRMALLYAIGGEMGYFVTLENIEDEKERNLEQYSFGGPLDYFMPVPGRDFAAFTLSGYVQRLLFIDLVDREMAEVYLSGSSQNARFLMYPGGSNMLISPANLSEVWFIDDMKSYHINPIIVDRAVTGVWLLKGIGKVVLDHGFGEGYVTFLDMDDPKRSGAVSAWGFLFEDVMSVDPDDYPLSTD